MFILNKPRKVNQAIRDACQRLGTIKIRTILCCIVPLPMISMDIARLCVQFKDEGVVGIDIAGSENYENSKKYKPHYEAFAYCKKHNVHRTAHAGEAQGNILSYSCNLYTVWDKK